MSSRQSNRQVRCAKVLSLVVSLFSKSPLEILSCATGKGCRWPTATRVFLDPGLELAIAHRTLYLYLYLIRKPTISDSEEASI